MEKLTLRRLIISIAVMQLMVLVIGVMDVSGVDVPILRQIVGFIYLTCIPGLLVLRIIGLRRLGSAETILYSVGLSLVFNMILGLLINMAYPLVGISGPIAILPVLITWFMVTGILGGIVYLRERRLPSVPAPKLSISISPPVLFLILLPLLAFLGMQLVGYFGDNRLLLGLLVIIALVPVLVAFNRFIPHGLYPLALVTISISLLWQFSLISPYLFGGDIHREYYFANLVLTDASWTYYLPDTYNSTLSVTMMTPLYSLFLGVDAVSVFKIIYPLLFSLVPLALFMTFRRQASDKVSFMAVFFFMSLFVYFTVMPTVPRQQTAEIFFALCILLMMDEDMDALPRGFLLLVFSIGIVISHYALYYFYCAYLVIVLLYFYLTRLGVKIFKGRLGARLTTVIVPPKKAPFGMTFVILVVFFGFFWFMNVASGLSVDAIVDRGYKLYTAVFPTPSTTTIVVPSASAPPPATETVTPTPAFFKGKDVQILRALGLLDMREQQELWNAARVLQIISQILIITGIMIVIASIRSRFKPVFLSLTLGSCLLLAASIFMPFFASFFNMDRIYHIALFLIAPYCVLGGLLLIYQIFRWIPAKICRQPESSFYFGLLAILLLVPYFLFSTGFIFEVTEAPNTSASLDPDIDTQRFNIAELRAKDWLLANRGGDRVYADSYGYQMLLGYIPKDAETFTGQTATLPDNAYIYLRSLNVRKGEIIPFWEDRFHPVAIESSTFFQEVLASRSRIYDNGTAQVYR